MRRVWHAGAVCLTVLAGAGPAASSDAPLRILFIGNCLICTNDLPLMGSHLTEAGLVQIPPRQAAVLKTAAAEALEPLAPHE